MNRGPLVPQTSALTRLRHAPSHFNLTALRRYPRCVADVGFRIFQQTVSISDEQARWLADELRRLRPVDVTHAAQAASQRIEASLANGSREVDAETTDEGLRAVLMALEDLAEAPEPFPSLQELHDVLVAELVRRASL